MITTNPRIRFCENNMITAGSVMDYSSQLSEFPFSNCYNSERTKVWKPAGFFLITTSNNKLYINDGSDKTATITSGEYISPALLATQIQTQLNAIVIYRRWKIKYHREIVSISISRISRNNGIDI